MWLELKPDGFQKSGVAPCRREAACWVTEVAGNETQAYPLGRMTRHQGTKTTMPSSPPASSQAAG